ncbi:MAG: hypothetical protein ABI068_12500 [Ktedonobacterales bacterium]
MLRDISSTVRRRAGVAMLTTFALVGALALAACSGTGGTGGTGGGGPYGSGGATNTPAATTGATGVNLTCASGAVVCSKTVSISGTATTVLADNQGMTLYTYKPDTATTVACTGGCASAWPALTVAAGATPAGSNLPGKLSTINGANGNQVEYNGHPLYRYSGDQSQSDANGQGIGGIWFVVALNGGQSSSGSGGSTGNSGY